jgi:hypothetical protein
VAIILVVAIDVAVELHQQTPSGEEIIVDESGVIKIGSELEQTGEQ